MITIPQPDASWERQGAEHLLDANLVSAVRRCRGKGTLCRCKPWRLEPWEATFLVTMFVQFIDGPVDDASAWRRQLDRWQEQCADGAVGWLGTTAGVSDDGQGFIAARFESVEAAHANSERPDQSAWWSETESCFSGPASFEDCDDVQTFRGGGSDTAGFVQVIRGQVNDVDAGREMFLEGMDDDVRPDVLGGMLGLGRDGRYTMVVYFSSEQDARTGEQELPDDDFQDRMTALHDRPPRFLDLSQPWMWSAAS